MASNGIGEPAFADAVLTVYEDESDLPDGFPVITDSPTLKAVEKGRNTVKVCAAKGEPKPIISWMHDYVLLNLSEPRYRVLPTGSLQIRNSKEQDEGKYECVAQNEHGLVFLYGANLFVRVRHIPPHFSVVSEDREVLSGGDVNLECIAAGSPMPYVSWHLGDVQLTPEESAQIGKNVLMLSDITGSGIYICVAESSLGRREVNVQVTVKDEHMSNKETTTAELMSDKETTTAELEYVTSVGKDEKEVEEGSSSEKLIADGLTQMAARFNKIANALKEEHLSSLFGSCTGDHIFKDALMAMVVLIANMAKAVGTKQCAGED